MSYVRKEVIGDCTDLAAGLAGEHMVCAELLLSGYDAFMTEQICAYDVAVDVGGKLIRIQVKSTRCPRAVPQRKKHTENYQWHVRRSGKKGQRVYTSDAFDLLALVALDTRQIAYVMQEQCANTFHISNERSRKLCKNGVVQGRTFSMFTFDRAMKLLMPECDILPFKAHEAPIKSSQRGFDL